MENSLLIVAPFLIALAAAALIHPCIVKIAKMKKIVDNPNARKLQKEPVPILGGVVVYFGIFFSVACTHGFADCSSLLVAFAAMMIMLYTGTMDDILDLRPSSRSACLSSSGITVSTTSAACGTSMRFLLRNTYRLRSSPASASSMLST